MKIMQLSIIEEVLVLLIVIATIFMPRTNYDQTRIKVDGPLLLAQIISIINTDEIPILAKYFILE